ncbi:MAG: hypothetical protein IJ512_06270 [Ruminococcus sp.]|nr:hypothetical protein [Ruminococcus sp.]
MPIRIPEKLRQLFQGENSMRLVVLAGLAGLVCILLSSFFPDDTDESAKTETVPLQSEETAQVQSAEDYAAALEKRLENILMQIEGVGSCRVMITVSGSASYSYAQDMQQHSEAEQIEIQREHVVLDEENGDAPLVEQIANPEVIGVIVACEGGEKHVVRELIFEAVHAALDVPSSRICVTKRIHESGENS